MSSLSQLSRLVKGGQLTAQQLVSQALNKAQACQELNVFISLSTDALGRAKQLDASIKQGKKLGKLAGIPFAVKDNFLVEGTITTAGAKILADFKSPYTASSVQKLLDQDAILIGKTNLDAFGHGTSTENSYYGVSKHPQDPQRVAGGSSGGSAAAVAADIVPFALGTDTGGSVRLPASFCGVVGYKPTYGLISRYGVVAMASSTDCVASLTKTAEDADYLRQILAGRDQFDGTSLDSTKIKPIKSTKNKLAVIKEFTTNLEPTVAKAFERGIDQLKQQGHQVIELSLPSLKYALACYYILIPAEISSNLSRYQGLVYGQKVSADNWQQTISKFRSDGFMPENKRRILIGTYVLSSGYYDAYYQQAQRLRTKLVAEFEQAFAQADCLLSPVTPTTAFKIGDKSQDPIQMYQADLMTVAVSLVGLPAVSAPLPSDGLPVGLQIIAPQTKDQLALSLAAGVKS